MDKIKAMIADDEYLERVLLKSLFPWEELQFELVGEAGSGEELLQKVRQIPTDVIFLDICMPFLNGLQAGEQIRRQPGGPELVVISGHQDFCYAQSAIHIGAAEYLLKPISREELEAVGQKVRRRVEEKRRTSEGAPEGAEERPGGSVPPYGDLVTRALRLLQDSYGDSGLSLKNIAERLYVNPSYLCRAFKRETGVTLTDSLLELRIRRGMEYLRTTNLKAYEIAAKIGISDAHYFSTLFKKQTGMSIQDYRKSVRARP